MNEQTPQPCTAKNNGNLPYDGKAQVYGIKPHNLTSNLNILTRQRDENTHSSSKNDTNSHRGKVVDSFISERLNSATKVTR